jgi:hypothetical protein
MKQIAFLSILFAALIEFAFERARFDLWIMVVAIVAILWNVAGTDATLWCELAEARPHCVPFRFVQ